MTSIQALTLGGDLCDIHHILKILWPHPSYPGHDYLPNLSDLTVLISNDHRIEETRAVDCRRLVKAFVEDRQSASRSLQRLTAPRFLLKNDIGWMRGQVGELELVDDWPFVR